MNAEEKEQTVAGVSALLLAVILTLALMCGGCGTTLRKTVAATATGSRIACEVTRDVCRVLAAQLCQTNPCPALERCHKAERLLIGGSKAFVEAASELNQLPPEVIDARR